MILDAAPPLSVCVSLSACVSLIAELLYYPENVKEYLQLFARAANDEAKAKNIKLVFEKQNQGSAQTIAKLQVSLASVAGLVSSGRKSRIYSAASSHDIFSLTPSLLITVRLDFL